MGIEKDMSAPRGGNPDPARPGRPGAELEPEAFSRLATESLKGVYRLAFYLAGNHQDADDLVQEAFLRAYQARDRFQPGTRFEAWVKRIAANLFVDSTRKRKRRREVSLPDLTLLPGPEIEEDETSRTRAQLAVAMLEKLPANQRIVLVLQVFEGMKPPEIAETLSVPTGTVWWRLHSARKKLKTMIEKAEKKAERGAGREGAR